MSDVADHDRSGSSFPAPPVDPRIGVGAASADTEPSDERDDTLPTARGRSWRPRVEPGERRKVIETLFGNGDGRAHWSRYFALLTLSAVIAAAGLLANSSAVVIGAMLVAPLMTPIVGIVAAISLDMPKRAAIAVAVVVLSTVWTIAVSWGVAAILPDSALGSEVLSRTAPDVRDLLVALAAGVAGTWATARTNVSSALPGVAVAVALVPPLATIGVTLNAGEIQYAEGATLLFLTNLIAIIGIGLLTMIAVGFVPGVLLTRSWRSLGTATAISLAAIAALSWPLWQRSVAVAREANVTVTVEQVVHDWLLQTPALELDGIERHGRSLTIDLVGPVEPPPADELVQAIIARLDDRFDVRVRWSQRLDDPGAAAAEETEDDPSPIDQIGNTVDEWLAESDRPDLSIEAITVSGSEVVVRIIGPRQPPSAVGLQRRLDEQFPDDDFVASIIWTEVTVIDEQSATLDAMRAEMTEVARAWTTDHGLELVGVEATFDDVVVRTAGIEPPDESGDLHDELESIGSSYGVTPQIVVTFEERRVVPIVATTTTSTTTTTTSTTTTTTTTTTVAPPVAPASAPAATAP